MAVQTLGTSIHSLLIIKFHEKKRDHTFSYSANEYFITKHASRTNIITAHNAKDITNHQH